MFHMVKVAHFLKMNKIVRQHQKKLCCMRELNIPFFCVKNKMHVGFAYETSEKVFSKCNVSRSFNILAVGTQYSFSTLNTVKFTQTCYCNANHVKDIICNFTCQAQSACYKTTLVWHTLSAQDPVSLNWHLLRTVIVYFYMKL